MTYVPYKRPPIRRLHPYQYQPYESGTLESHHATHTLLNQTRAVTLVYGGGNPALRSNCCERQQRDRISVRAGVAEA
jgi:hypothetical protein